MARSSFLIFFHLRIDVQYWKRWVVNFPIDFPKILNASLKVSHLPGDEFRNVAMRRWLFNPTSK